MHHFLPRGVLVPRLPSSSFLFPFPYGPAALAAPPSHLRSWIGQHARFEPGEAASHMAVRRHALLPARPPRLCLRVGSEARQLHEPHQPRCKPERRRTTRAPRHRQATHLPALRRASCISPVALSRSCAFCPPPVSPALARQSHAPKHKENGTAAATPPYRPKRPPAEPARPPARPPCVVRRAPCPVRVRVCAAVLCSGARGCAPEVRSSGVCVRAACCSLRGSCSRRVRPRRAAA